MEMQINPKIMVGINAIHQARERVFKPSAIIFPREGVGGCTPKPKKASPASSATSSGKTATEAIMAGGIADGSIDFIKIESWGNPIACPV